MATDVRVGGAFVTLSAQSGPYVAGVGAATAANRRLIQSYAGFSGALTVNNRLFSRFSASVTSSLIATAAYAAGVGVVASGLRAVVTGFLDYDQALIRISKTTGIANEELERLGANLVSIGTERFRGRRPIDVARSDIFDIAVAAGQAGVDDPRGVQTLTRAAAALQSSSDLIGDAAVRALTRYLQITGQSIERTDAIASAFTHLGNNIVGTEAEISRFAVRMAQNLSAVGQATDESILGISATLLEAGVEMEAAGTALQRAQVAILSNARAVQGFEVLGPALGGAADEAEALRQRFVDGTASAEDYDRTLFALLRTISELTPAQRQPFIAEFFGTGESNVRITRVIGALANRMDRLTRNTALANEALASQDEHFIEAERASEAYRARLQVVGRQLEEFGTNLGSQIVPGVTAIAENLDLVGTAALFAATGLATGFGRRRIAQIRETRAETLRLARAQEQQARQQVAAARFRQAERARGAAAAATGLAAPLPAGAQADLRGRQTTQLLRSLRQYERAAQTSAVRTEALVAAQTRLAAASQTAARRIAALGRGLFFLFGGLPGLILGGLAAAPLIISALREEVSELRSETDQLINSLQELEDQQQQQAAGLTDVGARALEARELLVQLGQEQTGVREELLEGLEGALAPSLPGFFARRISEAISQLREGSDELSERAVEGIRLAGFGDALDQLLASTAQADELRRLLETLGFGFEAAAEQAAIAGDRILQTFEALPPSVLQAEQTFAAFQRSLADARDSAGAAALFDLSIVGLGPIEQAQRRLIEGERLRIVQFQRANALAAEQAVQARDEAVARRDALLAQVDQFDVGTEAREEAERALNAAERQLAQTTAQVAVTERLSVLSAGLTIDAERQVELGRQALEQRRAQVAEFEAGTAQQVAGIRPDLDSVQIDALRERIRLENDLEDAQREVTQTRLIDADASVAHQQALREYYRVLNAGADALRSAQDDLLINERARELAARRILELTERRAAAGDQVTDALLEEVRAAQVHLARLRAEQAELELTLAAVVRLQEAYRALAEGSITAARRDNPFADLILGADELNQQLDRVAASGVSNLADGLAELVVRGKADFRDLAESIIQDLVRVFIQATIVNNLVAGLGLGGTGGGLGALFGNFFHEGGRTEERGRRRQLRGGLRPDELFAILQKGEVVVPRHLAPHLLSGNFDALRGWLARLPRFHEGGVAGGGHLPREDIVRLTAAIQQLQTVVSQLQVVVTRVGGVLEQFGPGLPPSAQPPAQLPAAQRVAGLPRAAQGVAEPSDLLDQAKESVRGFAASAGETLRAFFLDDIPRYAEQARQIIDQELTGEEPIGPQSRQPPLAGLSRVTREFERQEDRDARRAREQQRAEDRVSDDSIQELLDRAREQTEREQERLRQLEEQRLEDTQLFSDSVQLFADASGMDGPARRSIEAGEFRGFFREMNQDFRDTILEIRDRAQQPGDPSQFNRLRELVDEIEVDVPIPPGYRFEPPSPFYPQVAAFGRGRGTVGDTPRPDLFPDSEDAIIMFRQDSGRAFEEARNNLTATFGAAGTMGQLTSESQGLLNDLFNAFGGQLTTVLNDVLGGIGGGGGIGIGSLLGSLFGFHEGGEAGPGASRYYRSAGLRSDELLAVLQRGEIVLPRGLAQRLRTGGFHSLAELQLALSRLPRFHEGGTVGGGGAGALGGGPTRIELINTTNTPIEAVDNGQRVDAGSRVQSLILRDIRRNGPITQGMRLAIR